MTYQDLSSSAKNFYTFVRDKYLLQGDTYENAVLFVEGMTNDPIQLEALFEAIRVLKSEQEATAIIIRDNSEAIISPIERDIWYFGNRAGLRWENTKKALSERYGFLEEDIAELDLATNIQMNEGLVAPHTKRFSNRGLVLGHVQSGKTTNFLSLIAKAADSGYRLIIVLSGMTDNLREQTQERLDSRLFIDRSQWTPLTQKNIDFNDSQTPPHSLLNPTIQNAPVAVAIVKKNKRRLKSLHNWLSQLNYETRSKIPLLVIDDEADQATPNTARPGRQTEINRLVEALTDPAFMPKNVYLGYTATPFANFFMDDSSVVNLYPNDFIFPLKPGKGYIGAEEIFGRDAINDADEAKDPEVTVLREISSTEVDIVRGGRWRIEECLEVGNSQLLTSVLWFILATACREYREGKRDFSTMLIHTSSKTADHAALSESLKPLFAGLRDNKIYEDVYSTLLREIWDTECSDPDNVWIGEIPSWAALESMVRKVAGEIIVKIDNFRSDDRISYPDDEAFPRKPRVVIGGNTLSRGLTLEGLVTSYFMRTSRQYDSILQMGRWFGYRPGYQDLQRIWLPNSHPSYFKDWFKALALVEAEIREQISQMREDGLAPGEVAVRIRNHPIMQMTRPTAMRNAAPAHVSLKKRRIDIAKYPANENILTSNLILGIQFLDNISKKYTISKSINGYPAFLGIPSLEIIDFLNKYQGRSEAVYTDTKTWIKYIEEANKVGELELWNIYVASPSQNQLHGSSITVNDKLVVNKVIRNKQDQPYEDIIDIKTLSSLKDSLSDISNDQMAEHNLIVPNPMTKDNLQNIRKEIYGNGQESPGLLGFYFIDAKSQPKNYALIDRSSQSNGRKKKIPLDSTVDILGLTSYFPDSKMKSLAVDYQALNPILLRGASSNEELDEISEEYESMIEELEKMDEDRP